MAEGHGGEMKDRQSLPDEKQTKAEIPVVAVLLTCGVTSRFAEIGNIKYKALLPFNGRPIVDFVSTALCNSQVEKVFIVHEPEEDIKTALTGHEKIVLVECNIPDPTMVGSVICSMERLFEFYGEHELNQKQIMFVPCDIPLAQAQDFNALIDQTFNVNADYYCTVIRNSLLHEDDMGRRFRKMHFNELGDVYSFQPVNFFRSRLFKMPKAADASRGAALSDNREGTSENMLKTVKDIRKNRHSVIAWVRFAYRVTGKAGMSLSLQILFDLLRNRITESKFKLAVYRTLNVKAVVLESQCAAFSLDIDNPADLEYMSRLTGQKIQASSGK